MKTVVELEGLDLYIGDLSGEDPPFSAGARTDPVPTVVNYNSENYQTSHLIPHGEMAVPLPTNTGVQGSQFPVPTSALPKHSRATFSEARELPPCTCPDDLILVVQKLDDDEFHLTTLALDRVLQLQKWLIFQCCKSLDCQGCQGPPTVNTLILVVCDRLTEMFECIHKRLMRAHGILQGGNSVPLVHHSPSLHQAPQQTSTNTAPSQFDANLGSGPTPAQLFCSTSGQASNTASCNPMMFSDDFRSQYSDEEQVHMIGVLLRLQIKNFRQLLVRVQEAAQVSRSQARHLKVNSLVVRLTKASENIDGAMRKLMQHFSA